MIKKNHREGNTLRSLITGLLLIGLLFVSGCKKILAPLVEQNEVKVAFFVSDSVGNQKSVFAKGENIYFHFKITNNRSKDLKYTKSHGGPPIVNFLLYKNNQLVGTTDDGYCFPAIVVGGKIKPGKSLNYVTSWYGNPSHKSLLEAGNYSFEVEPYIRFDDFDLNEKLKIIHFSIR